MAEKPTKKLSALAVQAAMLAAQGYGPTESAKMLGCAKGTIVIYGNDPKWIAERDRWIALGLQEHSTMVLAQSTKVLQIHDQLLDRASEALDAALPDGSPNWPVRLNAIATMCKHPAIARLLGGQTEVKQGDTNQVTYVQVSIPADRLPPRMRPPEGDLIIEGTADEVAGELNAG